MIDAITIEGYKSIKAQEVKLSPINILIGGNGIGKTNFISAFELIRDIYEQQLQNHVLRKEELTVCFIMARSILTESLWTCCLRMTTVKIDILSCWRNHRIDCL